MSNDSQIWYALLGGLLPALLWLLFWLEEDHKRPEPRGRLIETFLGGMLAVLLVLPFEKLVSEAFSNSLSISFLLWAVIEETFKFGAAYFIALRTADDDEPIDSMIYMITAALGFAALENALFIINPLHQSDIVGSLITGNLRFIGSTLLHTVCSGIIGTSLALTFYKRHDEKVSALLLAFFLAIIVHATFNLFIINENNFGTFLTFAAVWILIAGLIFMFEKVKTLVVQ